MNVARLLVLGVAVCLLAGAGRGQDKTDYAKMLVGKWEVTKADPGTVPVGTLIEFTKDGKMKVTGKKDDTDLSLEGTYKVEKNTFTMTMKINDMERTQTITITKISDKEMSTKDKDDQAVELKRK
jgi:uncharacterized protein (TIGR03066 family)